MNNLTINGEAERTDQDEQGGRPSGYRAEYADQARKLCKLGAIDDDLADFFDVSTRTIHRWKARYNDFNKAVRAGKGRADQRVKMALYRRAVGCFTTETKVMQFQGEPVYAEIETEILPDVRACQLWLVNRLGWRMSPQGGGEIEDGPEPSSVLVEIVDGRLPPPAEEDPLGSPD